jgi:hypothetical protein
MIDEADGSVATLDHAPVRDHKGSRVGKRGATK